jgi:prepilin-type N-terminal cleavage/methylation domain-containing protein
MAIDTPSLLRRRGFSLIELLVVIGLIAIVAGFTFGGLFRTRDGNRLLAAEQLLADAVRQARHTARSSGSPVEVRLTPVVRDGQVMGAKLGGVSRTCLWSEGFDSGGRTIPAGPGNGTVVGRSGNGWVPSDAHPLAPVELERGAQLVRGSRTDGFYLACSVRPPTSMTGTIPLIMLGDEHFGATSQCGLELRAVAVSIHDPGAPPSSAVTVWEAHGWVWDGTSMIGEEPKRSEVSSLQPGDRPARRAGTDELPSGLPDIEQPIVGGRWVELGLLYDGHRLALYLDGRRLAEHHGDVPTTLAPGSRIHLGEQTVAGAPPATTHANAPIDDLRLYRLGTADLGELPGDVVLVDAVDQRPRADLGYRILCQPDGRVEVMRDHDTDHRALNDREEVGGGTGADRHAGTEATITLAQRLVPGTVQNARITISLDGRVSSSLVTRPAPTDISR